MTLHCVDQAADYWTKAFATDSIGCLPNDRQRFSNGLVVDPRPLPRLWSFGFRRFLQRADRVLTMKARHLDELVKDLFLLVPSCGSLTGRYCINQFPPGCHAQLPPQSATHPFPWDG
jgi:hypothetical protein